MALVRVANSPFTSVACNDSVIDSQPRVDGGGAATPGPVPPGPARPSRCGTRRALDVLIGVELSREQRAVMGFDLEQLT